MGMRKVNLFDTSSITIIPEGKVLAWKGEVDLEVSTRGRNFKVT